MRWDSLWFNAQIATCHCQQQGVGLLKKAALAVKDGKIVWIGEEKALQQPYETLAVELHNVAGALITPGLIDCHTHLVFAGSRADEFGERLRGVSYSDIAQRGGGILSTVRATSEARFDVLLQMTARRLQLAMQQGITSIEVKSGYGLLPEPELKQLRVLATLKKELPISIYPTFLAAHALPPRYQSAAEDYITLVCEETLPRVIQENLAVAVDAFCESIAFSPAQIAPIFEKAKANGLQVKLHAEQLSDSGGAVFAAQYGALSVDHLEYLSEKDVEILAKTDTVAVLLPGAFYFLREKKQPPIAALRQYQISIALATDCNPGTSPTNSLLRMMNMAAVFWQLTPEEILRAVTIQAAKALGVAEDYGSLAINKMADFVIWPLEGIADLLYAIDPPLPRMVIKHGNIIQQTEERLCHPFSL